MSGSHAYSKDGGRFRRKQREGREGGKKKEEDDGGPVSGQWHFSMMLTPRQYNRIGAVAIKKEEEQEEGRERGLGCPPWI